MNVYALTVSYETVAPAEIDATKAAMMQVLGKHVASRNIFAPEVKKSPEGTRLILAFETADESNVPFIYSTIEHQMKGHPGTLTLRTS